MANRLKISQILGATNWSAAEVAQAIKQAIVNFMATSPKVLTQIDVIVFQQTMFAKFQNALSGSLGQSQPLTTQPDALLSQSGVTVNVFEGDILKSNREVLINTTSRSFNLSGK